MRAGDLRHLVVLESPPTAADSVGWATGAWTSRATVYAAIDPISGREALLAAQRQAQTTHIVKIRYNSQVSGLDETWRIKYGSRYFRIEGRVNQSERDRNLELSCVELTT